MIRDFIEAIIAAETSKDVWSLHTREMAKFGFERLLYGFTRFYSARGMMNRNDFLILTNHDPEYVTRFIDGGLYSHAPTMRWAAGNTGPCSWKWIEDNADSLTDMERKAVAFNRGYGFTAGYSISFPDASVRNKGVICLIAAPGTDQRTVDAVWAEHGTDILLMNHVFHLKVINLPFATKRSLTSRQREVLEWVRDGKTTHDIAVVLGLTPATVEKHLRLARDVLEVDTTAQAVLKASFQNQIFVLD